MEVKFYDKRDFDFYNPEPYLLNLLSFIDNTPGDDDVRDLRWKLDSDRHVYLFDKDPEGRWFLKIDFVKLIKPEHVSEVVFALEMVLTSKARNIDSQVREFEKEVKRIENHIKDEQSRLEEAKKKLQDTLNVIEKYSVEEAD